MISKHLKLYKISGCNQNGSTAIIMAILLLAILTILGLATMNSSITETGIATNDMIYKDSFIEADGGTEVGRELLEQNIACLGFTGTGVTTSITHSGYAIDPGNNKTNIVDVVEIPGERDATDSALPWMNNNIQDYFLREDPPWVNSGGTTTQPADIPKDNVRDFSYPFQTNAHTPAAYTNVIAYGLTTLSTGSAVQMAAGYDGKGKGAASGGGKIVYQIDSRFNGERDSYAIKLRWRHLIGHEDSCLF